jgi:hypothetical protein
MEKKFNKEKFKKNLTLMLIFSVSLFLIGVLSLILSSALNKIDNEKLDEKYYGYYEGYDYYGEDVFITLKEESVRIEYNGEMLNLEYEYVSTTRAKEEFNKVLGEKGIIAYTDKENNLGTIFWIREYEEKIFLIDEDEYFTLEFVG